MFQLHNMRTIGAIIGLAFLTGSCSTPIKAPRPVPLELALHAYAGKLRYIETTSPQVHASCSTRAAALPC